MNQLFSSFSSLNHLFGYGSSTILIYVYELYQLFPAISSYFLLFSSIHLAIDLFFGCGSLARSQAQLVEMARAGGAGLPGNRRTVGLGARAEFPLWKQGAFGEPPCYPKGSPG